MAAPSENRQRVQGALTNGEKHDDVLGNGSTTRDEIPDINLDLPPPLVSYEESYEITRSTQPERNGPPTIPMRAQEDDGDELIVMGCRRCFHYVMTRKNRPQCPACKNTNLIDIP